MTRLLPLSLLLALASCTQGSDAKDTAPDTGGDGFVVEQDDADGDTILDIHEGQEDADGDGKANYDDKDADGDSIRDIIEAGDQDVSTMPVDSDGDGVSDFLDLDSDNNCIGDADEAGKSDGGAIDSDDDGVRDYADDDNDGDGIKDIIELDSCSVADTDGDTVPDYMDTDADGDGIGDQFEGGTTAYNDQPQDQDDDGTPDYRDLDSDGDGITDAEESGTYGNASSEPRDTDNDGVYDYIDTDADGDSEPDAAELELGTDPYDSDSDGDGFTDGAEVTAGTDPMDPTSVIDGVYVTVPERTSVEENFDFEVRIEMGDIGFITDTTGSMGGTISAINSEFAQIVSDIAPTLPDAEYAVSGHDDFPYSYFGSPGIDSAWYLRQQVTSDTALVQDALSKMTTHSGGDGPESGMEAIYMEVVGEGYDMNCNGTFDAQTDIKPFIASATDPFGGGGGELQDSSTPGAGTLGGIGFRGYSLPVVVEATDNYLRDPESSNPSYNAVPGGCPLDAGQSDTVTAMLDAGAYLVGVSVNGNLPYTQMVTLAELTGSYADLDGDGVAAEVTIQKWSGSSTAFRETVVTAISQLVQSIKFSRVDLSVDGDIYGFVTDIQPAYYEGLGADDTGTVLTFQLSFRGNVAATSEDQLYKLSLNVLGDESILLDTLDIIVRVPGNPY